MPDGPIRRTAHACVQCRERKQKCGGVTSHPEGKCTSCQTRDTSCSFTQEALDPRFNPYLRIQSHGPRSPSIERSEGMHQPSVRSGRSVSRGPISQSDEFKQLQTELDELRRELRRANHVTHVNHEQSFDRQSEEQAPSQDIGYFHDTSLPDNQYRQESFSNTLATADFEPVIPIEDNQPSPSHHSYPPIPIPQRSIPLPTLPQPIDQAPLTVSSSTSFEGPMRVLHDLGAEEGSDSEENDPIKRQVMTAGEARRAFKIFFEHCHLNAPFLDPNYDGDPEKVRRRSSALFLNIVTIGARFWSHSSRRDIWIHTRYPRLIRLLDDEMTRLTLKPRPRDNQLETVQAWMLYSHWMPVDIHNTSSYRSRFSESSAWQCLGSAIRWATLLGLDRSVAIPFLPPHSQANFDEVRAFRTMLYLTESDYYLALSTRKSPTLPTGNLFEALPTFLVSIGIQATDHRLAALFRVVQSVQVMGGRADSIESLEVFDEDVSAVDQEYKSLSSSNGVFYDKMSQHFPFTSLRWYRLSFASTLLPSPTLWHEGHPALRLSIEWASQIIYHLSASASETPFQAGVTGNDTPLEPDPELVGLLSFAIDQYYMVIAYTASFLVLAWQHRAMDNQLQSLVTQHDQPKNGQSSTLFRLVDLASRTLERCAPARGHLATRYAGFLRRLANTISEGPSSIPNRHINVLSNVAGDLGPAADPPMTDLGGVNWDGNWLTLLQNTGMSDWPFEFDGNMPFS